LLAATVVSLRLTAATNITYNVRKREFLCGHTKHDHDHKILYKHT